MPTGSWVVVMLLIIWAVISWGILTSDTLDK